MSSLLLPAERVRCRARPHWVVLAQSVLPPALLAAVALAGAVANAWIPIPDAAAWPLFGAALSTGWAAVAWLRWSSTVVLITDLRAIRQSGVLRRRRSMVVLDRIQDVRTERGAWGRLLGFGDVVVTTVGAAAVGPGLVLTRVDRPDEVALAMFAAPSPAAGGRGSGML